MVDTGDPRQGRVVVCKQRSLGGFPALILPLRAMRGRLPFLIESGSLVPLLHAKPIDLSLHMGCEVPKMPNPIERRSK